MDHPFFLNGRARLVWLSGWRQIKAHPGMALLVLLGVAIGVATAVAVDLANQGAMRAMRLSVEAASGLATHRIIGPPAGIPETFYAEWCRQPNAPPAAPIIEGTVRLPDTHHDSLTLLGIDFLAEARLRPHLELGQALKPELLAALLIQPDGALLLDTTADRLQLQPGAPFQIEANGTRKTITLLGVIATTHPLARQSLSATLLTDIATAQEILGMTGQISRMDLILKEPNQPLPIPLPPGLQRLPAHERLEVLENLTRSFRTNLTALSLLALLVGMFIIHNAMSFSVVQRRTWIGLLRAQGVTRHEILTTILLDALLLGLPGTLLGILLGVVLGDGLVQLMARTINDLYFRLQVVDTSLEWFSLLKGAGLGIGATLMAAWFPAREAAMAPVITALSRTRLEQDHLQSAPRLARIAVGCMVCALGLVWWPTQRLEPGLIAMALLTIGAALLAPWFTIWLMERLQPAVIRIAGWQGKLAVGGVQRGLSRTGSAVAALTVATAMVSAMGILIHGFRHTMIQWLDATTLSDIYVSAAGTLNNADTPPLDPVVIRHLSALPGIASVGLGRRVNLDTPDGIARLHVLDIDYDRFLGLLLLQKDHAALWPGFQNNDLVLITESLAQRRNLHVGASLILPTPHGPHPFTIGGIHRDFRSDAGMITLSRPTWLRHWQDPAMSVMGLQLQPGMDPETMLATLRATAGPDRALTMQSNRALREHSLEIFDRTFAITRALRLLALLTALFGVLTALAAIRHERVRELATLRAIGLTIPEIRHSVLLQSLLLGLAAGTLALPLGLVQGWLLIDVINYRAFGWTLESHLEPGLILQPLLVAIPTACLAAIPAARHMARTSPAEAMKDQ
ncbi:MAG: ABC transporter permease [Magnetococcales bacterium]|nr:ABC transporter permease [Magnetococcales bacterium]